MKKRILALVAMIVVMFAVAGATLTSSAKAWDTWDYPYLCYAYQSGFFIETGGVLYQCWYVGANSPTGFAYIPSR